MYSSAPVPGRSIRHLHHSYILRGLLEMRYILKFVFKIGILLTVAASLSACVKTSTTTRSDTVDPAAAAIQVFYSPPTDRPYTELGLVSTQSGQTIFHDRSAQGMIAKLQQEAAKLGADAIIVRGVKEGTWGLQGGGTTGFARGNADAVAIKFNQ